MIISRVSDSIELKEAFGFRKKIFVEREGLAEEHENDIFDFLAHHYVVRDASRIMIGYFRLIPINVREDMFRGFCGPPDEFSFEKGKVLEFSRVASALTRSSKGIIFEILLFIHEYARSVGVDFFCGTIRLELIRRLERAGWEFFYLGESFDYEGVWKVKPFLCKVSDNF